jgi:hypothetical protein
MNVVLRKFGSLLAKYLAKSRPYYERFSVISQVQLISNLQPGDVLLVEGNSRVSTAIKYLTQSTWSHVSLYVGDGTLVEADLVEGVISVPVVKYVGYNLRICRPFNLTDEDRLTVVNYVLNQLGHQYDTRNIFDLMRYLVPTPPVPSRYRRDLIALGSGDPTRAICSTLVAQAFQSVKYPILTRSVEEDEGHYPTHYDDRLLESRHYTHFTPRDFDLSPYFEIVKPTLSSNFNYKKIRWQAHLPEESSQVFHNL